MSPSGITVGYKVFLNVRMKPNDKETEYMKMKIINSYQKLELRMVQIENENKIQRSLKIINTMEKRISEREIKIGKETKEKESEDRS